jgi:hypothetical protein
MHVPRSSAWANGREVGTPAIPRPPSPRRRRFALVPPTELELRVLHRWLDCWRGVGDVVTGMKRQGYDLSIGDHGGQWIAVFYEGDGGYEAMRAAGTARATLWGAVQRAAWDALTKQEDTR